MDAVLHVGVEEGTYLYNRLYESTTKEDILSRNASRYAPAAIFNNIIELLEAEKTYAFIGKPCDIAAMQNFIKIYPEYKQKIAYYLAIFVPVCPVIMRPGKHFLHSIEMKSLYHCAIAEMAGRDISKLLIQMENLTE